MEIEDLFTEDKKPVSMEAASSFIVYDYFEKNSKNKQTVIQGRSQVDPMSKGFDIRAFRIKQAHLREREEKTKMVQAKKGGGLGQFLSDDTLGVSLPTMDLGKAEGLVIDQEKMIANLQDEDFIRREDEQAQQKRTTFSFGGESVRDRIKKRKMNAKIGSEVHKLEKIIMQKKGGQGPEQDQESGGDEEIEQGTDNKRVK